MVTVYISIIQHVYLPVQMVIMQIKIQTRVLCVLIYLYQHAIPAILLVDNVYSVLYLSLNAQAATQQKVLNLMALAHV